MMKNTLRWVSLVILFLILSPFAFAKVEIKLGEPYVNLDDLSKIKFFTHSNYYEICSSDQVAIPVRIVNKNKFTESFEFKVNRGYASLPVSRAQIGIGKGAILPVIITPSGFEDNTTVLLEIIGRKEAIKRSVNIKTNILDCYSFDLITNIDKDSICGGDSEEYVFVLANLGKYGDLYDFNLDAPEWVDFASFNESVRLGGGVEKELIINVNPSVEEKGLFNVNVKAFSGKVGSVKEANLEITVSKQDECYDTSISVDNVKIDYFGKSVPVVVKNNGANDVSYDLAVQGVDWYQLSQEEFSLGKNEEKTINLALYPTEDVVGGDYSIKVIAKSNGREFMKEINVSLVRKRSAFDKLVFYLNYFRYHIALGIVLLIFILLFIAFINRDRIGKKKTEKKEKKEAMKEVKKEEKKEVREDVGETRKWLVSFFFYLLFLGLLALLTYSTFKYKTFYERVFDYISGFFVKYFVPYFVYFRYILISFLILVIVLLLIDFFKGGRLVGKIKKKKTEKKVEKKKKLVEVKEVVSKVTNDSKSLSKAKLKIFEYAYLLLVAVFFLAIIVYIAYKLFTKSFSFSWLSFLFAFFKDHYLYFIGGLLVLFLLIVLVNFLRKRSIKGKGNKKKIKVKIFKLSKKLKNILLFLFGLIFLSGVVYLFIYYGLVAQIIDFLVIYYPYFLMGLGVLLILLLILHFHAKKIS